MRGILAIFTIVIIFAVVAALMRPGSKGRSEDADESGRDEGPAPDMDASFLDAAQKADKRVVDAVVVHSLADLAILRSLLYSSEIENYVRNDHVSALLPGVGIDGLTSMVISIFEDDYESARQIVNDYLDEKRKGRKESRKATGNRMRNVGEFIVTGRFVSSGEDSMDPAMIPIE